MEDLQFKAITEEDAKVLPRFYAMRPTKSCEGMFLDNFLWQGYWPKEYAIVDDRAVLWRMCFDGEYYSCLPLCVAEDLPYYTALTQKYFNEVLGEKLVLYVDDEEAMEILKPDPEKYEILELTDDADYLYDAEKLRTLAGKKYHKKKNHVNAFLKEYEGRFEYRTLGPEDKMDMWRFLDRWRETKGTQVEDTLDPEVEGIHGLLNTHADVGCHMGGIYIDGQLEAFSIGIYNPDVEMAIISIEKANPEIRGLYPFISQQFLIHEFPEAKLVNREEDMGLPGLRKAKQSYNPIGFTRKFQLTQR